MGFESDPETLKRGAERLRSAQIYLDIGVEPPDAVDAGFSSDVINAALARVAQARVVVSQIAEDTAAKVDAANGTYADVENTNEGRIRYEQQQRENDPAQHGDMRTTDEAWKERRQAEWSPLERASDDAVEEAIPDRRPEEPATPTTGPTPAPPR